jgi:hypothetical protein
VTHYTVPVLNESLASEAEAMLRDGLIEGLARRLRRDFPSLADEATAAIGQAVERLVTRPSAPDNPRGYLAASAYNEMKRLARRAARTTSLDALRRDSDLAFDPVDPAWTVEETALLDTVYREVRAFVESWETAHVRVVTLLYVEAAYEGEPLSSDDAAVLAAEILGEEVDAAFVRTWKSRGYRRLRQWVVEALERENRLEEVP